MDSLDNCVRKYDKKGIQVLKWNIENASHLTHIKNYDGSLYVCDGNEIIQYDTVGDSRPVDIVMLDYNLVISTNNCEIIVFGWDFFRVRERRKNPDLNHFTPCIRFKTITGF